MDDFCSLHERTASADGSVVFVLRRPRNNRDGPKPRTLSDIVGMSVPFSPHPYSIHVIFSPLIYSDLLSSTSNQESTREGHTARGEMRLDTHKTNILNSLIS